VDCLGQFTSLVASVENTKPVGFSPSEPPFPLVSPHSPRVIRQAAQLTLGYRKM